ncbi:MAG TPA: cyanophycinase [Flavobacteriaceae bacterium]|nr:cyanophycinase [Flavobacteriaceae bacterium]
MKISKNPKGKLLPMGGHVYSKLDKKTHKQRNNPNFPGDEVLRRFLNESITSSGDCHIGLLLTAAGKPEKSEKYYQEIFKELGCRNVSPFNLDTKKEANDSTILKKIEKLSGIFISGGDQSRINDTILNTDFHRVLLEKYENEKFIVAGTSAGAMCLSKDMISSGEEEEGMVKGTVKLLDGLGFIRNLVIDTHFHERGRWGRLLQAVLLNSDYTGIGLATDTGLLIENGKDATVLGSGEVVFFEVQNNTNSDIKEKRNGEPISVRNLLVHSYSHTQKYELRDL